MTFIFISSLAHFDLGYMLKNCRNQAEFVDRLKSLITICIAL
jgi:hypothetical protein